MRTIQNEYIYPESLAALRQVGIEDSWLQYQQVGILMSNYREQTDYVFRKKTRKAQDRPTELNIQKIDQTEEFSSIPVNETTNSNAGTQNTSVKPKKKPRQKSQVQHSQAYPNLDEHKNSTILGHQEYRQHLDEPRSYQYSKTSCEKFQLQQHQSSCITKEPKYQQKRSSEKIANSINITQVSSLNSNQKKTLWHENS
ncbi:Hypothetical_protein [Hexamita inflata]|uniref:Hypothetical_protein n=1 Tax=Hexamita inflata TaxID=28002 RepID=A0AA86R159_9EUKA|nr:Hypothetical protein HINF_LOCUS249 [Hexamita inflata]CAI9964995.1 Hypothetical protein HINF_LOCUS52640 [Hexamita inflata]CAI9964998.1 Hypothetical protein HINF_LOCUS52643 [Hexamita inflata]CAI9965001.1 Hypothetical protein HINF_LOCUS52646 [Hexamita inflata]